MKKRPVSLLASPGRLDAHRELAAAVIRQAILDAGDPAAPAPLRDGARRFLAGSPMLRQWCTVAGIDLAVLQAKCRAYQSAIGSARPVVVDIDAA
jgi:hypothetical protein